jgi:hypothetical protein
MTGRILRVGKGGEEDVLCIIVEGERGGDDLVGSMHLDELLDVRPGFEFLGGRGDCKDQVSILKGMRFFRVFHAHIL